MINNRVDIMTGEDTLINKQWTMQQIKPTQCWPTDPFFLSTSSRILSGVMSHAPAATLKRLNSDILNDPLNWVNGVSSDCGLVIVVTGGHPLGWLKSKMLLFWWLISSSVIIRRTTILVLFIVIKLCPEHVWHVGVRKGFLTKEAIDYTSLNHFS